MRLLTWNCAHKRYDTSLARAAILNPDVLVFQEAHRPDPPTPDVAWFGDYTPQSVAVTGRGDYRVAAEPPRPGTSSTFAARVTGPVEFTVLAVWAKPEPTYSKSSARRA